MAGHKTGAQEVKKKNPQQRPNQKLKQKIRRVERILSEGREARESARAKARDDGPLARRKLNK